LRYVQVTSRRSDYDEALRESSSNKPDYKKAFIWLRKAHHQRDRRATYALGTWYLHGRYVKKNVMRAIRLIELAAAANVSDALFDLAVSYEKGQGVRRSEKVAARLYLEAALSGDHQAAYEVGRCLYYGIGFLKDRSQARVWFDRARALGIHA
jgi:TPR repeat protein